MHQQMTMNMLLTFETKEFDLIPSDVGINVVTTNVELDLQIQQMIAKNEGQCKVCGKTTKHKHNMKSHAETHLEGNSHTCHICSKTSSHY